MEHINEIAGIVLGIAIFCLCLGIMIGYEFAHWFKKG